jgi:hypothetical protein
MRHANKFGAWCRDCSYHVPPGDGFLVGKDDRGIWRVRCRACAEEQDRARWAEAAGRRPPHTLPPYTTAPPPPRTPPPRPTPPPPHCLAVLGLPWPVEQQQVKKRFRQLALMRHPDQGGDPEMFNKVKLAYDDVMVIVDGTTAGTRGGTWSW